MQYNYKLNTSILLLLLILSGTAFAQIPNAGFENWHSIGGGNYDPDGWGTINSQAGGTCVRETNLANVHSGTYAMKLHSINFIIDVAPGIANTGTINTTTQEPEGGFVVGYRPTKFTGWYKAAPAANNFCRAEIRLFKRINGIDSAVGTGSFNVSNTVTTYTKFIIDIAYNTTIVPDSGMILLFSTDPGNRKPNADFWIDDLALVNCATVTAAVNTTPATTVGGSQGSATAVVTNGTAPYTYVWNPTGSGVTQSNKPAGNYAVTVTDDNGCTASASGTISQPSCTGFSAAVTTTPATTVGGSQGTATAVPTGGASPYTYAWTPAGSGVTQSSKPAGVYTVTITDNVGCKATASGTISQPSCAGFSAAVSTTNATTAGGSDGTATAAPTGGTSPFTYAWSPSGSGNPITGLSTNNYCVTITDAVNCKASACGIVSSPSCAGFSVSFVTTHATTVNGTGSINATVAGGTGPFGYNWDNGAATTEDLANASQGQHCLVVTDAASCVASKCDSVKRPNCSGINVTAVVTHETAIGNNDGAINTTATGGVSPYAYLWNDAITTDDRTGLAPGRWCVTVTDAAGCTISRCDSVRAPGCNNLAVVLTPTNATVFNGTDGSVSTVVTGGTSPYTYKWTNAATGATLTGVGAGQHCVTVTDGVKCNVTACATVSAPSGIAEAMLSAIKIYPNPTRDVLTIETNTSAVFELTLLSIDGRILMERKLTDPINTISLDSYISGLYLVRLKEAGSSAVKYTKIQIAK